MVYYQDGPGPSDEWEPVENGVPEYTAEDRNAPPKTTSTALNIRYRQTLL